MGRAFFQRGKTPNEEGWMKKRQTMGKMMRDRELRERRAMKQQKKDERKLAAIEGPPEDAEAGEPDGVEGADAESVGEAADGGSAAGEA
jgi:hypothetical protein